MEEENKKVNEAIINAFNNSFLISSLTQTIINNMQISGTFKVPNNKNIEGPYELN